MASIAEVLEELRVFESRCGGFDELLQRAEAGDTEAMVNVGCSLESGRGTEVDTPAALRWFERAAALGDVYAMHNLGVHYDKAEDYVLARHWYGEAAERGDESSMCNLGCLEERGEGGPIDHIAAQDWYRRSAEHGDRQGTVNYARALRRSDAAGSAFRIAELFRDAARRSHTDGIVEWARCLDEGIGVAQDEAKAEHWMRKAALCGDARGADWLAKHELWTRAPWVWIPGVSYGPVRFGEPVEDFVESLGLVVDANEAMGTVAAGDAAWDSQRYGLTIFTERSRVSSVYAGEHAAVHAFYRDLDLMGCEIETALRALGGDGEQLEFEIDADLDVETFAVGCEAMAMDVYVEDGVITTFMPDLRSDHPLWDDE